MVNYRMELLKTNPNRAQHGYSSPSMNTPEIVTALNRLIAAAEHANAAWKANPEKIGTEDQGVAALMAVQTSIEGAKAAVRELEKRRKK